MLNCFFLIKRGLIKRILLQLFSMILLVILVINNVIDRSTVTHNAHARCRNSSHQHKHGYRRGEETNSPPFTFRALQ